MIKLIKSAEKNSYVWIWSCLVVLPDLGSRVPSNEWTRWSSWVAYPASCALSFFFWRALFAGLSRRFPRRRSPAYWSLMTLACGSLLAGVFLPAAYRRLTASELPISAWTFFLRDPAYAASLIRDQWSWTYGLGLVVLLGALVFLLERAEFARRKSPALPVSPGIWGLAVFAVLLAAQSPVTPDLLVARILIRGGAQSLSAAGGRPPAPSRFAIRARMPPERPDIIIFLHENLSAFQWPTWSGGPKAGFRLPGFLKDPADRAVWFPHARTSAQVTDVSVPSIFTGLPPDATRAAFMESPFLWQQARAAGYKTALFSSQTYDWAGFKAYFLDKNAPEVVQVAENFPAMRVNDHGLDDRVTVGGVERFLSEAAPEEPIFLVVQFNDTHQPCYTPDMPPRVMKARKAQGSPEACQAAARYDDRMTFRLLEFLKKRGRLDRAFIVNTADHGSPFRDYGVFRLESFREDVLRVPLFVKWPQSWPSERPEAVRSLLANRSVRVSNLDIYPTILDVLGSWPLSESEIQAGRPVPEGFSLLRPVPDDRPLVVYNTGAMRSWNREQFGLYLGRLKWIVDQFEGVRVYDSEKDIDDRNDLLPKLSDGQKTAFLRAVSRRPFLARALRHAGRGGT